MKLKKLLSAMLFAGAACSSAHAGAVFTEGFDNVAGLAGAGWVRTNLSSPGGTTAWFQGNPGVFASQSGAANSYIGANYLNAAPGGTVSNWLFTPVLSLQSSLTLDFALRLAGGNAGLVDTVEVYVSTQGSSTSVSDFSLLQSFSSGFDTGWQMQSVSLGSLGGVNAGRLAFRYFVGDTNLDGDYIGIDSVSLNVPEPGSLALLSLALVAAAAVRRRA